MTRLANAAVDELQSKEMAYAQHKGRCIHGMISGECLSPCLYAFTFDTWYMLLIASQATCHISSSAQESSTEHPKACQTRSIACQCGYVRVPAGVTAYWNA